MASLSDAAGVASWAPALLSDMAIGAARAAATTVRRDAERGMGSSSPEIGCRSPVVTKGTVYPEWEDRKARSVNRGFRSDAFGYRIRSHDQLVRVKNRPLRPCALGHGAPAGPLRRSRSPHGALRPGLGRRCGLGLVG